MIAEPPEGKLFGGEQLPQAEHSEAEEHAESEKRGEEETRQRRHAASLLLAEARRSRWQPRCVVEAFLRHPARYSFTLQIWLELEAIRSPLALGKLPESEEEIEAAAAIFGATIAGLSVEEAVHVAMAMREAVDSAFAMAVRMEAPGDPAPPLEDNGFGTWVPLWAALVTQCGLEPEAAKRMEVGQAYALICGMRNNQGWRVAGTPYNLRGFAAAKEGEARG